jgi:hypothetical protein
VKASSLAIAAVVLAAAIALPVEAADVGPRQDVRAIRHDVPILLASQVSENAPAVVDDVVIEEDAAIATWRSGGAVGIIGLSRRRNRWWAGGIVRQAEWGWRSSMPFDVPCTAIHRLRSIEVLQRLGVNGELLSRAIALSTRLQSFVRSEGASPFYGGCTVDAYSVSEYPVVFDNFDGYAAHFALAFLPDRKWNVKVTSAQSRAPTDAELSPAPGVSAYYILSMRRQDGTAPSYPAGSSLDVWFPFVLDPAVRYTFELRFVTPSIDGSPGTLQNNVLHFGLPAFAMPAGKEAVGEIDGGA